MKRISNFTIFIVTIILLAVIVVTKTSFVLNEHHEEKALYAMHSKVEYYAKRCYLEGKCSGSITLQTLYDLGYLKEVINPINKEVINSNLVIDYIDDKVVIDW